jgi:hypothetical protein
MVVSFTPWLRYLRTNSIKQFVNFSLYLHAFDNIKTFCPCLLSHSVPSLFEPVASLFIKVATVEQQQWTDRLDISNSADSAGALRVATAATANVLICSGFFIWYLKTPVKKLATKILELLLLFCAQASTEIN